MEQRDQEGGRTGKLALAAMIVYTLLLCFATADDILGWGLLAGFFR
ncbi:MAG: hypothetical protein P9M14_11340 [Candidatus Alcyoniella australis]|nr:hypothetical protein [Candidatus Alcyoniella australis]